MKDIPSAIEIKKIFSDDNLPTINITENTMHKILNQNTKKSRATFKRLLIAIPLAITLISSTVFAMGHIWLLKGPNENSYNYSLEVVNTEPKTYSMFSNEINNLEPGKVLFIFQKKITPIIIETHFGEQKYDSLEQISQKVGRQRFISPAFLPDGYKFKEATIDFSKISDSFIAELEKECQNEDQEYFCKIADIDPNNEVIGYSLLYQKVNQQEMVAEDIRVTVNYDWTLDEINERKYDQHAEKIEIKDFEAILTQWDWKSEIKWLIKENNSNTYISVDFMKVGKDFTPNHIENLKRVAESISK